MPGMHALHHPARLRRRRFVRQPERHDVDQRAERRVGGVRERVDAPRGLQRADPEVPLPLARADEVVALAQLLVHRVEDAGGLGVDGLGREGRRRARRVRDGGRPHLEVLDRERTVQIDDDLRRQAPEQREAIEREALDDDDVGLLGEGADRFRVGQRVLRDAATGVPNLRLERRRDGHLAGSRQRPPQFEHANPGARHVRPQRVVGDQQHARPRAEARVQAEPRHQRVVRVPIRLATGERLEGAPEARQHLVVADTPRALNRPSRRDQWLQAADRLAERSDRFQRQSHEEAAPVHRLARIRPRLPPRCVRERGWRTVTAHAPVAMNCRPRHPARRAAPPAATSARARGRACLRRSASPPSTRRCAP